MKKSFLSLLLIVNLAHLMSCSEVGIGMKGDGHLVEERGNPRVISHISGSGTVRPRN